MKMQNVDADVECRYRCRLQNVECRCRMQNVDTDVECRCRCRMQIQMQNVECRMQMIETTTDINPMSQNNLHGYGENHF